MAAALIPLTIGSSSAAFARACDSATCGMAKKKEEEEEKPKETEKKEKKDDKKDEKKGF